MKRSSYLHNTRKAFRYSKDLIANRYFWIGLFSLASVFAISCVILDQVLMPRYTRHEAVIYVPDVVGQSVDDAQEVLTSYGLGIGEPLERFDRLRERDRVLEQRPGPSAPVKPGRVVYVTINRGTIPSVTVPRVLGLSLRGARNQLATAGLAIRSEEPDSLPSPYANAITRQEPAHGSVVQQGDSVKLWYGTGLGSRMVVVPDVKGLPLGEAQTLLRRNGLRSVVLDLAEGARNPAIVRQSRDPGAEVREGFEVRLFTRRGRS